MARRASHYVASGTLVVAALVWAARDASSGRRALTAPTIRIEHAYVDYADTLRRGETVSDVLARGGIAGSDGVAFLAAAGDLPVRRLRAGLVLQFRRLQTESIPDRVSMRVSHDMRLRFERGDSGWVERAEAIPWTISRLRVTGTIQTSLYEALDRALPDSFLPAAERRTLAWAIADVYDWQVDFTRDVRPADRFRVVLERLESPEGERRFGRILAADVEVAHTSQLAFFFSDESGRIAGFFDEGGRSLKRAFLRAPLQFRRISSGFGGRYHPVLHTWRNHQGIDFAAPYGTPVRATADGIVTQVGREVGGYGNLVELRHPNGIRTRYGHLSAFARGLRPGQSADQGETIGYVGSTGLSTGPHLHYEFLVNGRPTNPQRKDMGAGAPVPRELRSEFDAVRGQLRSDLDRRPAAPSVVARSD